MEKNSKTGHPNTTSLEKFFSMEPKLNKDPVTTSPKPDIKFDYILPRPKTKKLGSVPFPSSDGIIDVSFGMRMQENTKWDGEQ